MNNQENKQTGKQANTQTKGEGDKQNLLYWVFLALITGISLAGNAYQGVSYAPKGDWLGSKGFMTAVHITIDMGKFLGLALVMFLYSSKKSAKFYFWSMAIIFGAAISMFSMGNLLNKYIKGNMNTDSALKIELVNTKLNLTNKIAERNANKFIQNCKWQGTANRKNGAATKGFCDRTDSKGNIQPESRPVLLDRVNALSIQISKLDSKTYFPMAQYINSTTGIAEITVINTLILITIILVEFLILASPYMALSNETKTTAKSKLAIKNKRKTDTKKKAMTKRKQKKTVSIVSVDQYLESPTPTFVSADEISNSEWNKMYMAHKAEKRYNSHMPKELRSKRQYKQTQIATLLNTSQSTVSKKFKEMEGKNNPVTIM